MKTISPDRTYIDYTRGNEGVRVWKDRFQGIARNSEDSDWQGRERVYPIPVEDRFVDMPMGGSLEPIPFIMLFLNSYHGEVRNVITGNLSFEFAVSSH